MGSFFFVYMRQSIINLKVILSVFVNCCGDKLLFMDVRTHSRSMFMVK